MTSTINNFHDNFFYTLFNHNRSVAIFEIYAYIFLTNALREKHNQAETSGGKKSKMQDNDSKTTTFLGDDILMMNSFKNY